jgi:hypothetical protein
MGQSIACIAEPLERRASRCRCDASHDAFRRR